MSSTQAARLEHDLSKRLADLTPTQKREVLDFADFIATRSPIHRTKKAGPIEALFDLAPECPDTDLAENHDQYLYGMEPL
jgi:hypothetical protein